MNDQKYTDKATRFLTGDLSYSIRLREDVVIDRTEKGRIILFRNGMKLFSVPENPLFEYLCESWMTEASIDQMAQSMTNIPAVYYMCEKLFSFGLLQGQYGSDEKPLFTILPAADWRLWKEDMLISLKGLTPGTILRHNGHSLVLEAPLSRRRCVIHDEQCLIWLMEIIRGETPLPVKDVSRMAFYKTLRLAGTLENDKSFYNMWEFHDLLFFHHSSIGFHDDPIGATWRLKNKVLPEPLLKSCEGDCIPLAKPGGELMKKLKTPFDEVLANRRSGRIPGKRPVTLEELGVLLYTSARIRNVREDPKGSLQISQRPSPSGGALHSLEIYPMVRYCSGLSSGVWRYDPAYHRLESINVDKALLDTYLGNNPYPLIQGSGLPHIRLIITSRIFRELWKYEKIAYRLVMQDLGCLYQTLNLAATAIGLAACIIGTVDARRLGAIMKLDPLIEPVIGEMTLSSQ